MADQTERRGLLSIFSVLFAVLSISNFLKPLQIIGAETGFVLFGTRLTGTANLIADPLAGLYLLAYISHTISGRPAVVPMPPVAFLEGFSLDKPHSSKPHSGGVVNMLSHRQSFPLLPNSKPISLRSAKLKDRR